MSVDPYREALVNLIMDHFRVDSVGFEEGPENEQGAFDMEAALLRVYREVDSAKRLSDDDVEELDSLIGSWVTPLLEMPDITTRTVVLTSLGGRDGEQILCLSKFDEGDLPWRVVGLLPAQADTEAWISAMAAIPSKDELIGLLHPEEICNLRPDLLPKEAVAAMVASIPADWTSFVWPGDDPPVTTHEDFVAAYMREVYTEAPAVS